MSNLLAIGVPYNAGGMADGTAIDKTRMGGAGMADGAAMDRTRV